MATNLTAFLRQLSSADLQPVYLIAGAEHLLVLETADAVRNRARAIGYSERDVLDVEAGFDWNRLADAGRTLSLFASRRLIDLRLPSGKPGREGSAAIAAWCEAPPPDTALLITANDWSKSHEGAWVRAVDRCGAFMPIWPLKRDELPKWIAARMVARELRPSADAVALLAERIEGNLLAAAQEIDKLALLVPGGVIDVATLESNVADDARFDVFRLTDAAIAGDSVRALRIVGGLRAEGAELIPLLGWVLNQIKLLLRLSDAGSTLNAAFKAERVWPQRQTIFRRALKYGARTHWERCLAQAGYIDRIAKGRANGDAWRELERLVAAVAEPRLAADLIAP
ncbi:MAG: DNA polymerase III subunit delta [Rhodanobacteraceae bacterium]